MVPKSRMPDKRPTTHAATPESPTAPVRPTVGDATPSVTTPTTSATTASRVVPRPVTVSNRRLADGYLGESFLVWRCQYCGETGSLTAFPSFCPSCFAGRESLFYWTED